jgi:hypothetical protein
MTELKKVLMTRDNLTEQEADDLIEEMRHCVFEEGEDPEEVLLDMVGLEPDYVFDLLGY